MKKMVNSVRPPEFNVRPCSAHTTPLGVTSLKHTTTASPTSTPTTKKTNPTTAVPATRRSTSSAAIGGKGAGAWTSGTATIASLFEKNRTPTTTRTGTGVLVVVLQLLGENLNGPPGPKLAGFDNTPLTRVLRGKRVPLVGPWLRWGKEYINASRFKHSIASTTPYSFRKSRIPLKTSSVNGGRRVRRMAGITLSIQNLDKTRQAESHKLYNRNSSSEYVHWSSVNSWCHKWITCSQQGTIKRHVLLSPWKIFGDIAVYNKCTDPGYYAALYAL